MPKILVVQTVRILGAVAAMLFHYPACAATFSYVAVGDQAREIAISPDKAEVNVGHHGMRGTFCNSGGFFCFRSDELAFAVPKEFGQAALPSKWTFDGQEFIASKSVEDISILGTRLRVHYIDIPGASPPMRYWYDLERGVVAIQGLSPNSTVFLLTRECGFAARVECARSDQK